MKSLKLESAQILGISRIVNPKGNRMSISGPLFFPTSYLMICGALEILPFCVGSRLKSCIGLVLVVITAIDNGGKGFLDKQNIWKERAEEEYHEKKG